MQSRLGHSTKRRCVICGFQADVYDAERKISLCDLHAEDLHEARPWTLEDIPGEVDLTLEPYSGP